MKIITQNYHFVKCVPKKLLKFYLFQNTELLILIYQYIQNIPWYKRMFKIIIPIQKSSIISGYLLPFMTSMRELSLFMLLCTQGFILATSLDYFDEMGLSAFSSGINLILIITILVCNWGVNKLTGASLDKGIGGGA